MTISELKDYKKRIETDDMDSLIMEFGYYHGCAGVMVGMYLQEHLSPKALKEFRKKMETRWVKE